MTIRTRLNLWYATILAVALLVMAGWSYNELVIEKHHPDADDLKENNSDFADFIYILSVTALPAVVIGIAGGWWLARQALAPVEKLTLAAEKVHDRNLHEQLPRTNNGDELDRLTEVFNAMTARLDASFARIREFTLHASHELKTPLTILHGETETALHDETIPAYQRERLTSQLDEIQRLTKIVDGLTLLTKADAGQIVLNSEPLAFDEIVRDAFADAQILAKPTNLAVNLIVCEPCVILGDRHRLRQLLLNLTDNAVKYNHPGGTIEFSLRRAGSNAELMVSNTGTGISPEILPRVTERFFRGDAAHNSAVDGCGLGLSIAQWIVTAHGGSIQIVSERNGLTSVVIRLRSHDNIVTNKTL